MIEIITEQGFGVAIKAILLTLAWLFAQVSPISETALLEDGLSRAFDQMFSLGIMFLFILYIALENRNKDRKKDELQSSLASMIEKNIQAINEFTSSNKDVAKTVERSQQATNEALKTMTEAFQKLSEKIHP